MHNSNMADVYQKRRIVFTFVSLIIFVFVIVINTPKQVEPITSTKAEEIVTVSSPAISALDTLAIKGRAPKTGYSREQFGAGWTTTLGLSLIHISEPTRRT